MLKQQAEQVKEVQVAQSDYDEAVAREKFAHEQIRVVCRPGNMTDDERDVCLENWYVAQSGLGIARATLKEKISDLLDCLINSPERRALRLVA